MYIKSIYTQTIFLVSFFFIKVGCVTSVGFRGTTASLTTGRLVFGSDVATWENQFDHTDVNMGGGGGCQLVVQ